MAVPMTTSTLSASSRAKVPPLENGDVLTRAEFERRYEAMPHLQKAELIEGVVYVPSPVRHRAHSHPHIHLTGWLVQYEAGTPGIEAGDNGTVRLDLDNEPQPYALLFIDPACGGQARIDADDYIEGAPELVAEVASSSASYDLHVSMSSCVFIAAMGCASISSGACWSRNLTGLCCAPGNTRVCL
jgi:hypothetical protein